MPLTRLEDVTCEATAIAFGVKVGDGRSFEGIMVGVLTYLLAYGIFALGVLVVKGWSDGDGA